MLALKQNRFGLAVVLVFTIFNLLACAGYPSDPRAPETGDDTYKAKEDEVLNVPANKGILANDNPKEGTKIFLDTAEIETQNRGTVNLAEDGSFTYVPETNFSGQDQATYRIHNRKGKSSEGTIFFEVAPVNDPPEPQDDRRETPFNRPVTIDVLTNDVDPDAGDTLVIQNVGTPDSGSVRLNADGTLTYTPRLNHTGDVSFDYTVSDGNGGEGQAWVYIAVGNTGLQDDAITVAEGESITFPAADLLANDRNGAQLTVISVGQAQNGTVVLEGNNITYTPNPHYSGADSFTYTAQDGNGITASATVNVTVTPVADPPTISDIPDQEIALAGTTGNLLFTVADPDTPLNQLQVGYRVTNADPANLIPDNGVVLFYNGVLPTGTIRVTPNPALFGTATITVTVADPDGNQVSDAFLLTVNGPNQPPTINISDPPAIDQGTGNTTISFSYSDQDTPLDQLRVDPAPSVNDPDSIIISAEATGDNGNGRVQVTLNTNNAGTATITVRVFDPEGNRTPGSFRLRVNAVNENTAPSITMTPSGNQNLAINDRSIELTLMADDGESAPADLRFSIVSDNSNIATVNPTIGSGTQLNVTVTLTEEAMVGDIATITATVTDEGGLGRTSAPVSLQITVTEPRQILTIPSTSTLSLSTSATLLTSSTPSAPLAQNDIYSTTINRTLSVGAIRGVLANDRDAQDLPLRVTAKINSRLTLNADGGFTYIPPANFTGKQAFTYTVSNGGQSATATLTFVVGGNQVPRAVNDGYVAHGGVTLSVPAASGLLVNDVDPDGQKLSVVSTGVYDTLFGGEVNIQPDGSFTYIAPADFDGFDGFTYTASDGMDSAVGIAEVSVTP